MGMISVLAKWVKISKSAFGRKRGRKPLYIAVTWGCEEDVEEDLDCAQIG
jgi:hypothetical protein